jgi:iron complex outermembrane receptor protein
MIMAIRAILKRPLKLFLFICIFPAALCFAYETPEDLSDLSLEALMNVEITSVSKKAQKLSEAPAAVFVITQEDLKRSGATSIAEALRMVPGVHVGRIDANKWAISIRGLNGRFSNKLLVLMDGRTVYAPIYSGVFWETLDVILEDVERIEVIRGPGAAIWGANAVNGVINIITKSAYDTTGGFAEVLTCTSDPFNTSIRYGGRFNESRSAYRIYAKYFENDHQVYNHTETDARDQWHMLRTGFKINHEHQGESHSSLQGEIFNGKAGETIVVSELTSSIPFADLSYNYNKTNLFGGHLMYNWKKDFSPESDLSFQGYYDSLHYEPEVADVAVDTLDVSLQHRFAPTLHQEVVWGGGYRFIYDKIDAFMMARVSNKNDAYDLITFFMQDDISFLNDRLHMVLGSQFENNSFTGWEIQPSIRGIWEVNPSHSIWAAVSRAVRGVSRLERGASINYALPNPVLPMEMSAIMDPHMDSEKMLAYEVGIRSRLSSKTSLDITVFLHDYDDLRGSINGAPYFDTDRGVMVLPFYATNALQAKIYGFEGALDWKPGDRLRFKMAYTFRKSDLEYQDDSLSDTGIQGSSEYEEKKDPEHTLSLAAWIDITEKVKLDLWGRYVSGLPSFDIDAYGEMDAILRWSFKPGMEVRLAGQNLLNDHHPEYVSEYLNTLPTESERKGYVAVFCEF